MTTVPKISSFASERPRHHSNDHGRRHDEGNAACECRAPEANGSLAPSLEPRAEFPDGFPFHA
jgi:hypothetical protein